jgi:hypothetical protein
MASLMSEFKNRKLHTVERQVAPPFSESGAIFN